MDQELDREEVVKAFLAVGDFDSAEQHADSVDIEWEKAESLGCIARQLVQAGHDGFGELR